jgi:hypothetical protein
VSRRRPFWLLLLPGLLWLGSGIAGATTFLTLESTYLGDGWFQYQMNVLDDPFFSSAWISQIALGFTNQIDSSTTSTDMYNDSWTNGYSSWSLTNNFFPTRPYSETFLLRSSETSYRLGLATNYAGGAVILNITESGYAPEPGASLLGLAQIACLQPCSPEDADGSPTNYIFALKLLPDIVINRLIQTNGQIYGVDFTWDSQSTFVLQGTADYYNWTNIAHLWSYPPETVWTTNVPLNDYGPFYRVALITNGYATNLPPLASSLARISKSPVTTRLTTTAPRVAGCHCAQGRVVVNITAQSGQMVQVQAMDSHRIVWQTQQVTASGDSVSVTFDPVGLPSPVFFQVIAVRSAVSQ